MAGAPKAFSDLEIGIRELFRIVVPGAYCVILVVLLAPQSEGAKFVGKSVGVGVGTSFFLGLLGYALRPHERWAPYFLTFEKFRVQLNDEIIRVINTPSPVPEVQSALVNAAHQKPDHVALYKVFLEYRAPEIKDRIHYFSSFYYMLIELSFFSLVAAFWITAEYLLSMSMRLGHMPVVFFSVALITIGAAIQISLLYGLEAIKSTRSKLLMAASLLAPAAGIFSLFGVTLKSSISDIRVFGWKPDLVPIMLIFVAFSFERLGAKQWKSIIREQMVLVNAQALALREMSKKWPN